ncbi:hypothetical protein [Streptomyces sp. NPDC002403]
MGSEYSADPDGILKGSSFLGDSCLQAERLVRDFEEKYKPFRGWAGDVGVGDDFADQTDPGCEQDFAAVRDAVASLTTGFLDFVNFVAGQSREVRKPQDDALQDIHDQASQDKKH